MDILKRTYKAIQPAAILVLRPQFCRMGAHTCIPAVTLHFHNEASSFGLGRLHWCADHASNADPYRANAVQPYIAK